MKIEFENNRRIYYIYDANGTKLRKYYYEDNRLMSTTDYSGMFVYKDDHLDYILTGEGRIKWDDHVNQFYPEYFIKDHLGNVRSVITSNPNTHYLVQGTDYYPFGMEIPVYGASDNQLKYNSKELQTEADLSWYDYGARFYDPVLGRWHSVDPLVEEYYDLSPYNYALNNPISNIDPDGMSAEGLYKTVIDPSGEIIYHDDSEDKNIYQSNNYTSDGNTSGMDVVGQEDPTMDYSVGRYLMKDGYNNWTNLTAMNIQLASGAVQEDCSIESFFIFGAVFSPIKYLKIGQYIYKLVPTKSGGYIIKFLGLADDAAKTEMNLIPEGKFANHLFKGAGKLEDNPTNRALIQKISNSKAIGVDPNGKSWYTGVDAAGKSIYSYTQNGVVKGAGYMTMTIEDMIKKYGLKF